MTFPSLKEFLNLTRQGNLIPVCPSVPADLLTPVSAYWKLTRKQSRSRRSKQDFSFLLESVEGGETIARYTYLGADPFLVLRFWMSREKRPAGQSHGTLEIVEKGRTKPRTGDLMT